MPLHTRHWERAGQGRKEYAPNELLDTTTPKKLARLSAQHRRLHESVTIKRDFDKKPEPGISWDIGGGILKEKTSADI
jgi:hypothetical protein